MFQSLVWLGRLWVIQSIVVGFIFSGLAHGESRPLQISWNNNILRIHSEDIPGGSVEIWYLEAFCRKGAHERDWGKTVIPHTTRRLSPPGLSDHIELESIIEPGIEARHRIRSDTDSVSFLVTFRNPTDEPVDIEWAQPCIRVGRWTGRSQEDYWKRCFIFTQEGQTFLDRIPRVQEARYHGGQVYVPRGIAPEDVNPRPISPITPAYPIIGCVSEDGRRVLATAWEPAEELFQGVIVCIHTDFRIGGLQADETKQVRGKIYLLPNDPKGLLDRWRTDFEVK